MRLRIFIAVTHLLGAGHLTRAAAIAKGLAHAGHEVTLASGGMPSPLIATEGVDFLQLPPVKIRDADFRSLLKADGTVADPAYMGERRGVLLPAFERSEADVLVTELFPFGRRVLAEEFLSLLALARSRTKPPLIVSSVRDILVPPGRRERIDEAHSRLAAHYDAVLVHGDRNLAPLEFSWPLDDEIRKLLHYTGYVDDAGDPPCSSERSGIIVSAGSSATGGPIYRAALEAAALLPEHQWRILVGHGVAEEDLRLLVETKPENADVERARPDFRSLLSGAAASVSQAGYNTTVEVLRSRVSAILIPFEVGRETEQRLRAERLAERGLARVLRQADLSGETLAENVRQALAHPRSAPHGVDLEGGTKTVAIIERLAQGRGRRSRRPQDEWSPLDDAILRAADAGRSIAIWWRDDDAVADTPALERLLGLHRRRRVPLALAAIPALIDPLLVDRVSAERGVRLLIHGLSHANHALPGGKKAEFGADRALETLEADASRALDLMLALGTDRLLPVFVPPWNRIAPALASALPRLGYAGLSSFGRRPACDGVPALIRVNTHIDPIDWRGSRSLADRAAVLSCFAREVDDRASQEADIAAPIGVLTHHLVHDEAVWNFCEELFERLSAHTNLRYAALDDLMVGSASLNRDGPQALSCMAVSTPALK